MLSLLMTALALVTEPGKDFLDKHGDWFRQVSQRTETGSANWLKDQLVEALPPKKASAEIVPGKCSTSANSDDLDTNLFVFCSFSVPDESWVALSPDVVKTGGVFVLRGLPNNSFRQLAQNIHALRKKGVTAPIQINPQLFDTHNISTVPAFALIENQVVDRVTGNVSLTFALEQMESRGDLKVAARALKSKLRETR